MKKTLAFIPALLVFLLISVIPAAAQTQQYSLLYNNQTPDNCNSEAAGDATTDGLSFTAQQAGQITGIMFWSNGETGTHEVDLWDETGNNLAHAVSGQTVNGWNTVNLASPVAIQPGNYMVSYYEAGSLGAYICWIDLGLGYSHSNGPLQTNPIESIYTPGDYSPFTLYYGYGWPGDPDNGDINNSWNLIDVVFVVDEQTEPTETPSPSPTPSSQVAFTLSTGNQFVVERSITFGDISITVAVLILATIVLLSAMVKIPALWYKRR